MARSLEIINEVEETPAEQQALDRLMGPSLQIYGMFLLISS